MKTGLIIYNKMDAKKNEWFINECLNNMNDKCFSLYYKDEEETVKILKNYKIDFAIYRGRNSEFVKSLEADDIKVFNNSYTNEIANNKFYTYLICKLNNIPVLETSLRVEPEFKYPLVMKSIDGHGGADVFLIKNERSRKEVLKTNDKVFIYQEYIDHASDVRVYVLHNKVIGAVKRTASKDFRSNYSLGNEIEKYTPSKEMVDYATKIASILKADYIGVDFLIKDENIYLNEVEDPVGARMLFKAADINAPKLFVEEIKKILK